MIPIYLSIYLLIGFLFAISYVDKYVDTLQLVSTVIVVTIWWPIFVIIKLSSP